MTKGGIRRGPSPSERSGDENYEGGGGTASDGLRIAREGESRVAKKQIESPILGTDSNTESR